MANLITAQRTYATFENAKKALERTCALLGLTLDQVRWLIAVTPDGKRFVPTVVGATPQMVLFAHNGVMVVS